MGCQDLRICLQHFPVRISRSIFCSLGVLITFLPIETGAKESLTITGVGSDFVATISHGLATPLYSGSSPFLNVISGEVDGDGKLRPYIDIDGLSLSSNNQPARQSWCDAAPHLSSATVFHPSLYEVFPGNEFEVHVSDDGTTTFAVPKVFSSFVRRGQIDSFEERKSIYAKAFVDLFARDQLLSSAAESGRNLEAVSSGWATMAMLSYGESNILWDGSILALFGVGPAYQSTRAFVSISNASVFTELTPAAQETILRKVRARTSRISNRFAWGATALQVAQSFTDERAKLAIQAQAFNILQNRLIAESVLELVRHTPGADSALVAGAEEAVNFLDALSEERINVFAESLRRTSRSSGGFVAQTAVNQAVQAALAKTSLSVSTAGSLAGAAGGLLQVGLDAWDTSKTGIYLAALTQIGRITYAYTERLVDGQAVGSLTRSNVNLESLLKFNHHAAWLTSRTLNTYLYGDRGLLGRKLSQIIPFAIKDRLNPGLRTALQSDEASLLTVNLHSMDVDAAWPSLLRTLERIYQGPPCNVPGDMDNRGISIVAVVDSSGSMRQTDPRNLRLRALELLIDTLSSDTSLSVIDFDANARVVFPLTLLGPIGGEGRAQLKRRISSIDGSGGTSIGDGLELGIKQVFQNPAAIVLMTDGQDRNWRPGQFQVPVGLPVHSVALSDQADRDDLAAISARTGGTIEIARKSTDLQRIFSSLFQASEGRAFVLSSSGTLRPGEQKEFSFVVDSSLQDLEVQVSWPGSDIDLIVTSPKNRIYSTRTAVEQGIGTEASTYDIIRIDRPEPGEWTVMAEGVDVDSAGEPFDIRVTGDGGETPIGLITETLVPEVGEPIVIGAESATNTEWRSVSSSITFPDGTIRNSANEISALDQVFAASSDRPLFDFVPVDVGVYRLQVVAKGTSNGSEVMRTFDRTFNVKSLGEGLKTSAEIEPFLRR